MRERADKVLLDRGMVQSRQRAQALIMAGLVFANGEKIAKPGQKISNSEEIVIKERMPYVSRGGLKLEEALDAFRISVDGKIAADLGSSTGGFTDCLLQRGARKVYAVDVDTRQLDWRLREDSRVKLIEKNARYLSGDDFFDTLDIVTMDLSFISLLKVLPAVKMFLGNGRVVALVKPQFEAGKGKVGRKGVVRDPYLHEEVLIRVIEEAGKIGFNFRGLFKTSIRGQKGNQEFFVLWSMVERALGPGLRRALLKEAVWNEKN
jgi:23S rRNA (cytidine1920-2'-O)/16S rRNA (cytidine1409-2'-O)-methyltransferase